jgi:hypothetical protein
VITTDSERPALNNPVLEGSLAVAVEVRCREALEGSEETALVTVLEGFSRRG